MLSPSTPKAIDSAAGDSVDVEMAPDNGTSSDQVKPDGNEPGLSKSRVAIVLASTFLAQFLVALDRTIISTAVPSITDEFNSLPDVGWYGSVYLLTCCAFQLLFGKFYTLYPVKAVYIISILLFEISSAICGAAPNSVAFIVGRAISGIGAAGIFAGTMVCVISVVPLSKRPQLQGMMGAVMGLGTVFGPLIGGGFTSHVSWRWCFYINLPFGGVAMTFIFFLLKVPDKETIRLPWKEKLLQLDVLGTTFLVPGVVCLLLALQWGGQSYPWSDGRVIALLVVAGVCLIAFVAVQILLPKTATLPPRLFKNHNVVASLWSTLTIGASQYIYIYYIPIWFQSIKGVAAVDSGIRLLPYMLGIVIAGIAGGIATQKVGYYTPFGIAGACIMAVGAGLIMTWQVDSGSDKWIGYQAMYGLGMGLCFQIPSLALQTVLPSNDVPMGLALMFFGQLLGATIFVSVGQNVLDNQLLQRLSGLPGFDKSLITSGGATSILNSVPPELRGTVLTAYNDSLRQVFLVGLITACLAVPSAAALSWENVVKKAEADEPAEKGQAPEGEKIAASD